MSLYLSSSIPEEKVFWKDYKKLRGNEFKFIGIAKSQRQHDYAKRENMIYGKS